MFEFEVSKAEGQPVGVVAGQVVDATTGQPLVGVVVSDLSTDNRSAATATTDANGEFMLTGLSPGVQNLTLTGYLLPTPVSATVTTTTDALGVELQATPAAQIAGYVTVASDGGPLANIEVDCTRQTTGDTFDVLTAADRSYSFDTLPADTYTVSVSADGYVNSSIGGITLTPGQTSSNQNFSLVAGATITGTVTSQTGRRRWPAHAIFVQSQTTSFTSAVLTATDGTYSLASLPADTYTITSSLAGYVTQNITEVQLATGGSVTGQNFELVAGASIQGTLTNASGGSPVADANLTLTDSSGDSFYATTDDTGTFGFTELPAGTYTLAYNPTNALPIQQTLTLTTAQTLSGVSLQVQVGGTIAGTVTNAADGTPLADVPVFVITPSGDELDTQSDASGDYSFANLVAGAYQVNVLGAPGSDARTANVVQLDGTAVPANLSVSYSPTISGTLQDASGNPIQGSVSLYDNAGDLIATAQCDSGGNYGFLLLQGGQFELQGAASSATFAPVSVIANAGDNIVQNIASGSCTLTVSLSSPGASPTGTAVNLYEYTANGLSYCNSATVDGNLNATFSDLAQGNYRVMIATADSYGAVQDLTITGLTATSTVTLAQLFSVSGVITDSGGDPLNDVTVRLTNANSSFTYWAQTGVDGSYSVVGVPEGSYAISVVCDGYQGFVQPSFTVSHALTLNTSLMASSVTIVGQLVDPTGSPVRNGLVSILDSANNWIGTAQTATDGTFAITTGYGANVTLVVTVPGAKPVTVYVQPVNGRVTNVGAVTISSVGIPGVSVSHVPAVLRASSLAGGRLGNGAARVSMAAVSPAIGKAGIEATIDQLRDLWRNSLHT